MTNVLDDFTFVLVFYCVPSDVLTSGLRQPFVLYDIYDVFTCIQHMVQCMIIHLTHVHIYVYDTRLYICICIICMLS